MTRRRAGLQSRRIGSLTQCQHARRGERIDLATVVMRPTSLRSRFEQAVLCISTHPADCRRAPYSWYQVLGPAAWFPRPWHRSGLNIARLPTLPSGLVAECEILTRIPPTSSRLEFVYGIRRLWPSCLLRLLPWQRPCGSHHVLVPLGIVTGTAAQ
ncbi:hypothetical protein OBBRIDRAFT_651636 [Obba rivulosa]|uniref:Uncharacterized protein n=1 Tax=Obba rivulosa TaxID=1052685 RepID=A0A8E2ASV4_9APHY|nr:hypothetical protein OBBRIDRAFT_651636 [Obba rivulosa]